MNHVELQGTLTQPPELRYLPTGRPLLELQLGGSDHVTGDDGQARELAWYHRATLFGPFAEMLAESVTSGDALYLTGRLNYRSYETQDGGKRSSLDVIANQVRTLGTPTEEQVVRDRKEQARLRDAINRVLVSGNLTRDAELRYTPSGHAVLNLGLAVNEKVKDEERTHFIDATAWRAVAEANAELKKGAGVVLVGRLQNESWEGQDGTRRFATRVEAQRVMPIVKAGSVRRGVTQPAEAVDIDDAGPLPF